MNECEWMNVNEWMWMNECIKNKWMHDWINEYKIIKLIINVLNTSCMDEWINE